MASWWETLVGGLGKAVDGARDVMIAQARTEQIPPFGGFTYDRDGRLVYGPLRDRYAGGDAWLPYDPLNTSRYPEGGFMGLSQRELMILAVGALGVAVVMMASD